jgi:hypothetical protein
LRLTPRKEPVGGGEVETVGDGDWLGDVGVPPMTSARSRVTTVPEDAAFFVPVVRMRSVWLPAPKVGLVHTSTSPVFAAAYRSTAVSATPWWLALTASYFTWVPVKVKVAVSPAVRLQLCEPL